MKKYQTIKRTKKGGKVIGQGSYGCVFSPPLKCKDKERPNPETTVSKLMHFIDADTEISIVHSLLNRIKEIQNYEKYTLLNIDICDFDIGTLTEDDLSGNRCQIINSIYNEDISLFPNLNDKYFEEIGLNNMKLLQMPKGGATINQYLLEGKYKNEAGLIGFFNNMVDLLVNFIVPMNEKGVYHRDLKSDNILVNDLHQPQLIDWGLSTLNEEPKPITKIPEAFKNWTINSSIMFNKPLSAPFLFEPGVGNLPPRDFPIFSDFKKNKFESKDAFTQIYNYKDVVGNKYLANPHFNYLWMNILKDACRILGIKSSTQVFKDYTSKIYTTYTEEQQLGQNKLFKGNKFIEDFYHNIDPYGWAMSFNVFFEFDSLQNISANKFKQIQKVAAELIIYLFTDGAEKLDINKMAEIIGQVNKTQPQSAGKSRKIRKIRNIRNTRKIKKTNHKRLHKRRTHKHYKH